MDREPTPHEEMEQLYQVLNRLVQRMTRRAFATPRLMQMDVGNAITLLYRVDEFPRRELVRRALPDLLRELGKRRPDLHRYVVILEETLLELAELRRGWPRDGE